MRSRWRTRTVVAAAAAATGAATLTIVPAAGYRFALEYRRRAGFPARRVAVGSPADHGLPFEDVAFAAPTGALPGWFVPARGGAPGPGVVLVHGWESNRARMLPNARFLHAAGFHTLMFDVRGHGQNPPEDLPISAAEFGADTLAAIEALAARPEVTTVGVLGHSMGGAGAAIGAAATPLVRAVVLTSTPADAHRLTRRTFELAGLPFPALVAHPLAHLTTRVYLRPRRHAAADVSADRALGRFSGPILLVHGSEDEVVPLADLDVLAAAARRIPGRSVETLVVAGGFHRWLYEHDDYRASVAAFLARHLGGPLSPIDAAAAAVATEIRRPPDTEGPFTALEPSAAPAPA